MKYKLDKNGKIVLTPTLAHTTHAKELLHISLGVAMSYITKYCPVGSLPDNVYYYTQELDNRYIDEQDIDYRDKMALKDLINEGSDNFAVQVTYMDIDAKHKPVLVTNIHIFNPRIIKLCNNIKDPAEYVQRLISTYLFVIFHEVGHINHNQSRTLDELKDVKPGIENVESHEDFANEFSKDFLKKYPRMVNDILKKYNEKFLNNK